jgi:predicted MFS family arabinose efflux permease
MAAVNSYVTAVRGKFSVVRAITFVSAMYSAGAIVGPWLGGQIGSLLSLRQVYFFATGLYLLSSLIILGVQPQPIQRHPTDGSHEPLHLSKPYLVYLGVIFLAMFAMYLPLPFSSNYLQNQQGLTLDEIGRLGSMASVGIVVLSLALGHLSAPLGLLLGQLALGLFSLILWRGSDMTWFTVGYFLLGGYRLARTMAVAHARSLVHASNVGLAYGMIETANGGAVVLAPWLAGQLYEYQPALMYPMALGLIILSMMVTVILVSVRQKG